MKLLCYEYQQGTLCAYVKNSKGRPIKVQCQTVKRPKNKHQALEILREKGVIN